jgi:hypothetical protein
MADLGMSLVSLQRVLLYLRTHNKLTVSSQLGSAGYTVLQTTANIYQQLVQKRSIQKGQYSALFIDRPNEQVQRPAGGAEISRQVDQFFEQVGRQEPRRGAG